MFRDSSHVGYGMIRSRKSFGLLVLLLLAFTSLLYFFHPPPRIEYSPDALGEDEHGNEKAPATTKSHPIHQLITRSEADFKALQARQSRSLEAAVAEYQRRYGIPPPPHFDKWYDFATSRNIELIDEYDTIHEQLTPFWALEPRVIRERVRESIGFDNALIAVLIRDHQVARMEGGGDMYKWHRDATPIMLKSFLQYLPDMDLAFNIHDEPRIVMQHDDLARHVQMAKAENMPRARSNKKLSNSFSPRPADMNAGDRIKEYKTTRFNRYAHQGTWFDSRLSCPADSAARRYLTDNYTDDTFLYTNDVPLGFLTNTTAFSDICNTPSLRHRFGFFDRPNAFDVAHELFPIFSQSKVSSFQDILYPSPWYFMGKVVYEPHRDGTPFASKQPTLYWRGSTTGGFSRDGGWRNQHRQQFVQKTMPAGTASYLFHDPAQDLWVEKEAPMSRFAHLFDVKFTYVGQCDPGDCDAQKEFFDLAPHVNMFDALQYKYLLDIDGNAFSGRYYAWLQSHSLVYKLALFREWHDEILKPWVHYVPLGIHGTEYVESLRYFEEEADGNVLALRLAEQGREWAGKVLRNADMEVWYFRLLLEYGRLIDDRRYEIGFSL